MKKVNFKRAGFAVLAGLMMAGSAGIPVHASDVVGPTNITIKNAEPGTVYKAYKVFDGTQSGDKFAYTIKESSPFYGTVSAYANGIKLEKAAGTADTYIVTMTDRFDAATFATLLKQNVNATQREPDAQSDGTVQGTGTDATATIPIDEFQQDTEYGNSAVKTDAAGYFYVNTETGTVASLGASKNQNVTVVDKNRDIFDEVDPDAKGTDNKNFRMEVDDHDVEEGQVVNYTVHSVIPSTVGFDTYTYTISDFMSDGLQLDKDSIKIAYDGGEASDTVSGFTIDKTADNSYTVTIDAKTLNGASGQDALGKKFTITYSAKVLDAATTKWSDSEIAQLTHSTFANDGNKGIDSHRDYECSYTRNIDILKYAGDKGNVSDRAYENLPKLQGAQFVLANEDGTKFYKLADGKVTWIDAANGEAARDAGATVVVTDTDGKAEFKGLEAQSDDTATDNVSALDGSGKYKLYEISAPVGYNLLKDPIEIQLVRTNGDDDEHVANFTGTILPETGSRDAMILTVVGAAGVGAIAIYLATKKKEEQPQA